MSHLWIALFMLAGIEGDWSGVLDIGAIQLHLALHLSRAADGSLTGALDSIDQGAKGIPLSLIHI